MPGSRVNTRRKVRVTEQLSLLSSKESKLPESTWKSRGWTFQEQLLSRRMLIFAENLVSWKCDLETWDEETVLEPAEPEGEFRFTKDPDKTNLRAKSNFRFIADLDNTESRARVRFALGQLDKYIGEYTSRTLTYGSDILPAFQGAMRRYEATTGERLHWGLAHRTIDMGSSLVWTGGESRRQDVRELYLEDGTTIHMLYPGWS